MSAEDFLDTNILVYMFDETDARKHRLAESLVHESIEKETGCISYQVVQETLNVVVRKLEFEPADARKVLEEVLIPLWQINPSTALYQQSLRVHSQYRLSFYDSLIVAAALEAGCRRLYSEDMQHGQQIQGLTILNPFSPAAGA